MMVADTRAVPERAIEEGLFRYLLNRVNKHHTRIKWVTGVVFDREPLGEPQDLKFDEYESHIRRIVSEAVDCIFESVDEIIHFPEVTQGVTMCACSSSPVSPDSSADEIRAAARDEERCVWTKQGGSWADSTGWYWYKTSCGRTPFGEHDTTRPCWCGKKIEVK